MAENNNSEIVQKLQTLISLYNNHADEFEIQTHFTEIITYGLENFNPKIGLNSASIYKYKDTLNEVFDTCDKIIDKDFTNCLLNIAKSSDIFNTMFHYNQYNEIKHLLTVDSIILYFPDAQLFTICEKNNAFNFINNHKKFPPFLGRTIYEFVPNDRPQKIVVVKRDNTTDECIDKLKEYLLLFIKKEYPYIKKTDIIIRKNISWVELLINNWHVPDSSHRKKFIKLFRKYIVSKEMNLKMSTTVQNHTDLDIIGVNGNFYQLPDKTILDDVGKSASFVPTSYPMATTNIETTPKVQLTINIVHGNNNIVMNGDNNSNMVTNNKTVKEFIYPIDQAYTDFIDSLENDPPDWYNSDSFVEFNKIYNYFSNNFCKYSGKIYQNKFARDMKGRLYNESKQRKVNKTTRTYYKLI
jgi:hypothetical protein